MPASPDTFTVTCNGIGAIGIDYVDTGSGPDEDIVYAFVTFRPRLPAGTIIWAPDLTPPRGIQLDDVKGRFSPEDGKLRTIVGQPTNEKQRVTSSGAFTLTFDGETTGTISGSASPSAVQSELENLPNIEVGDVFVSGATANEKQTVTISGSPTTFTLTFAAQPTTPIIRMASASLVQAALQNLSSIGAGECSVSGPSGGPWVVEFTGTLAGTNVPVMTGTATPSGSVGVVTTVAGSTGSPYTVSFIGSLASTDVPLMSATGSAAVDSVTEGTPDLGVELVANTSLIGPLAELIYDVEFDVPESDRVLNPFAFLASTVAGEIIDLASVARLPHRGA